MIQIGAVNQQLRVGNSSTGAAGKLVGQDSPHVERQGTKGRLDAILTVWISSAFLP